MKKIKFEDIIHIPFFFSGNELLSSENNENPFEEEIYINGEIEDEFSKRYSSELFNIISENFIIYRCIEGSRDCGFYYINKELLSENSKFECEISNYKYMNSARFPVVLNIIFKNKRSNIFKTTIEFETALNAISFLKLIHANSFENIAKVKQCLESYYGNNLYFNEEVQGCPALLDMISESDFKKETLDLLFEIEGNAFKRVK